MPAVTLQETAPRSHTGHAKILSFVNTLAREKLDRLGDTGISSCKMRYLDTARGKPSTADGICTPPTSWWEAAAASFSLATRISACLRLGAENFS